MYVSIPFRNGHVLRIISVYLTYICYPLTRKSLYKLNPWLIVWEGGQASKPICSESINIHAVTFQFHQSKYAELKYSATACDLDKVIETERAG